jgi:putative hydrolase of the HAD superfamily
MIRYLYFDLGHVLVHFSHERGCRQLAAKSQIEADAIRRFIFETPLQRELESGGVTPEEFSCRFNGQFGSTLSTGEITWALSDIFWTRREIVPLITQLSLAGWPLAILSNTCLPHWEFLQQPRFQWLGHLFPRRILSYEEKSMKPQPHIYERAISMAQVLPEEIFFVDDRPENVEGALDCGLRAVLFESVEKTRVDLRKLGVTGHY